ncbi:MULTISPECIES: GNAT family N-acetyltransferase [unclassified Vibrio]|uniref:GNAT family N-acetyltransferase n=1 Tax=Vibrio sp. HB236076 TaxID=3232307 RepID=A0AB39HLA1_9VIBR|nr:GNAT family N-acetyltransferase [Vibrio sp. HB161653]MDP5252584.1 GNAT family N-acetyltransferase [Vibrio sp. HB161653]
MNTIRDVLIKHQSLFIRSAFLVTQSDSWIDGHIPLYFAELNGIASNTLSVGHCAFNADTHITLSQSQHVLGMEFDFIVLDFRCGFDANHFCRVLGTLVGGGIALIIPPRQHDALASQWLNRIFSDLTHWPMSGKDIEELKSSQNNLSFKQQNEAIRKIIKVATGHRNRPLVLTADRGRGKSSALGIACAHLLSTRSQCSIVVTAPSFRQVSTLFRHALSELPDAQTLHPHQLTYSTNSLRFVPPAEVTPGMDCDLLFVDEAGAIPVPMLKHWARAFSRMVFSTTVHGYEGSGRGFTLKFLPWLASLRETVLHLHLDQPIRWAANDKIEHWLNHHFVLDSEIEPITYHSGTHLRYRVLDKADLIDNPALLRQCIGLLVQAHYQTTPNDVYQLIENSEQNMVIAELNDQVVATCLVNQEGRLDTGKVTNIVSGKSRPKGQLATSILMTNLGCLEAGYWSSQRIMRIAVHPHLQRQGIATELCQYVEANLPLDFVSVSFGADVELLSFWLSLDFFPVRFGLTRDAASGTHSILMVKPCHQRSREVLTSLRDIYSEQLLENMKQLNTPIDIPLLRLLLSNVCTSPQAGAVASARESVLNIFSQGGGSFDFVRPLLQPWLLSTGRVSLCSALLLRAVFCHYDTQSLCFEFSLTGKKQLEKALRQDVMSVI